jgi:pyruvate/2-oxoglutarate dehydrogenase complex dihydrolipoamide acyltransferase (E2) component
VDDREFADAPFAAQPADESFDSDADDLDDLDDDEDEAFEGTFPAAAASAPLVLRTSVAMGEVRKLRAALAREWRDTGSEPGDEDVLIRAVARALRGSPALSEQAGDVALLVIDRAGERLCIVEDAARRPFREAVADLADLRETGSSCGYCTCTVVNFGAHGIDEGVPPLPMGHSFALALGAMREVPVFEGDQLRRGEAATLTLAYAPEYMAVGEAAWLLGRVRDLLEAPYALLAD